jgi:hypothetical protein
VKTPGLLSLGASVLLASWLATTAPADEVTLVAARDNTLFEDATGSLSDGSGSVLFAGNTGQGLGRRALVRFDVAAAVPAGRRIEQVTLTLHVSNAPNATMQDFGLHRVLETWGEGASSTTSGGGAPAADGDATWIDRFWPAQPWSTPGGSFQALPSATRLVGDVGFYGWSDPAMTVDVQAWMDDPASNHGWLILGDEVTLNTSRRFDSRENPVPESRPSLLVRYSSSVGVDGRSDPSAIRLEAPWPNPMAGSSTITFALPRSAHARLEVKDPGGRRVAVLLDAPLTAGRHAAAWRGTDQAGRAAGAGVFFYQLTIDGRIVASRSVIRLR